MERAWLSAEGAAPGVLVELCGRLLQDGADIRRRKLLLKSKDFLVEMAAVGERGLIREEPVLRVGPGKGRGVVMRGLSYVHCLISSGPIVFVLHAGTPRNRSGSSR